MLPGVSAHRQVALEPSAVPGHGGRASTMSHLVQSYVQDRWREPASAGVPVLDPATGDEVARVAAADIDFAAVVAHAREVGGPALRALTFHQRAEILSRLGEYLSEHVDAPLAAHGAAGGTLLDARVDVEGGIAALPYYARRALRELPDDTILVDGEPARLSRNGTFLGQTVYTSRSGVALLINAFNFPVWGMLEKLAPAMLAGLPVVVKPATATAPIAEMVFRQMIDSGVLPPGSAQFLAGSIGDLFDHLDGRDYIAFTGSAATAATLRSHPAVTERSATMNAEADSLNAAILGPDAVPGTEEFDLFVKTVAREVTGKTGQKCTAIRRALVPSGQVGAVTEALTKRVSSVGLGDPRVDGTRMGPVVSRQQRDEVAAATRRLMQAADVVLGGPDEAPTVASGDAERGAFFPPTVLRARDPRAAALHQVEAFGPVTTVIGYADADDAVELTALGEGSLVASVVSRDPEFLRSVVRGIAPLHGRLLILDRDDAAEAPPHGAVLPALIHGGPGRAGGGLELGGTLSVRRMMQATSISGSPAALTTVTGRWNRYAPQLADPVHPFRKHFGDLRIGETLVTGPRTISQADIDAFAELTGDTFYAHTDPQAAAANPIFGGLVAHGYLVISAAAGLFVDPAPGPVLANFGLERLRFVKPVYPGDAITVRLTCKEKTPKTDEYGQIRWDVAVTNADDEIVAAYDVLTLNAVAKPRL